MILLRLFGTVVLRADDGRELRSVVVQPKRLALLAYLAAAPGGRHRRDTLLAVFWPDLDSTHARGALNKSLHYLRRSLGENVVVSQGDEELVRRVRAAATRLKVTGTQGQSILLRTILRGR